MCSKIAGTKSYVSTCIERGFKRDIFPENETHVLETWVFFGHYETHV